MEQTLPVVNWENFSVTIVESLRLPPYQPASNGAAERVVQEVKKNRQRQVMADKEAISLQHKLNFFILLSKYPKYCNRINAFWVIFAMETEK